MTDVGRPPRFSKERAEEAARIEFGLAAQASPFPSERDQNFLLRRADGRRFVLKIANAGEDRAVLDMQNEAMRRVSAGPRPLGPAVLPNLKGEFISGIADEEGRPHFLRLVSFIEGVPLAESRPHSDELLEDLGRVVAGVDKALSGFDHPAANRPFPWDMRGGMETVRRHLGLIDTEARRALVEHFLGWIEAAAGPRLGRLRTSVIHNDANDYNVIVAPAATDPASFGRRRVAGLVDFGDMIRSYTLAGPAVACAYAMLEKDDPIGAAARVVAGYHAVSPLGEGDLAVLYPLAVLRLLMSVALCAYQTRLRPGDSYLAVSNVPAWAALEALKAVPAGLVEARMRKSCGFAVHPSAARVREWLEANRGSAAPLLGYPLRTAKRTVLDLSVGSPLIADPAEAADPARMTAVLFEEMRNRGARVGVGRVREPRLMYAAPAFRPANRPLAEGRTVHLGIDLFVEAGEPVYAPLEGTVRSVRDNDRPFDYGPTLILEHRAGEDGPPFFTLYGHLARASLEGLAPGRRVLRGEKIAAVGPYPENGGWPPHLHVQIMVDLLGQEGDFPGVARASELDVWLGLCPDPALLLDLPSAEAAPAALPPAEILAFRRERLGPSLSVSYRKPLKIVRGFRQYLYEESGRKYLDAVNNVPHVGHSHPRVVEAVRRQITVLNTNTRYLHDNLVRYVRRLTDRLPEPLEVVYLVNSGSEANDLALRLVRRFTGREDMVVVEGGYHGNLSSLIEISPYKFNGPGGKGCPARTHVVPVPDRYQGPFRTGDPEAGPKYAASVRAAMEGAAGRGRPAAGFIAESILSCAGQIVLPDNYLREAYRHVRAAGGVCIADEVQVGFGRAGANFWAFETQGVVPDVLTLGKPIGNGFPLAAVVTRRDIADAFADGMEYFNTYGGNPVSCAAGLAVLDVIEEEGLQRNALETGAVLKAGLERLAARHPLIGDVRGPGLFLGFELVTDRESRTRAPLQAAYIAERMREEGVLVSTDGPFRNVIKIKPPLCFSRADAELFLEVLNGVLGEDPLRP